MAKKKLINSLTMWEWDTLVAAWRYYEFRSTITSASFPSDIVTRFWWSGRYSEKVQHKIARQFACVDHFNGPNCWENDSHLYDCDKKPWCTFWSFCEAEVNNRYSTVVIEDGGEKFEHLCFWCEYTKRWLPREMYIANPDNARYCEPKFIKEVR